MPRSPQRLPRQARGWKASLCVVAALLWIAPWLTPCATASPGGTPRIERSDEDLLILTLELGSHTLTADLFAFRGPHGVLLPLSTVVEHLEIPLTVDVAAGRVEGWVLDLESPFRLDLASGTVTVDGVDHPLPRDGQVEAHWDELYVDAELLSQWWPLDFRVEISRLRAFVTSPTAIPLAQRLERRAYWKRLHPGQADLPAQGSSLPRIDAPYRWASWPAVDGTLDLGWQQGTEGDTSWSVRGSGLAHGDLFGLSADLFWSTTNENGDTRVSGRRLAFSRSDPEGRLLGPLRASTVRVGDLLGTGQPLITFGRSGRGLHLERSHRRGAGRAFDHTTVRGEGLPGWDAELYRNDQLLDFQTLGDDGRYEFRQVPLLVGSNRLRVSLYGPHGEVREIVDHVVVGGGALPAGETRYRINVLEQGRGLLGDAIEPGRESSTVAAFPGNGELLFGGSIDHGLSRRWTASVGALGLPIQVAGEVENHTYAWVGLEGSVLGTAGRVEMLHDIDGGWAGRLALQRRIAGLGVRFEHRQLMDFVSEIESDATRTGLSELRLDGRWQLRGQRQLPYSLLATWDQREGSDQVLIRGEVLHTQRWGKLRLANRWGLEVDTETLYARGRSTLHGRLGSYPLRGRVAYEAYPETEIENLSLDVRFERGLRQTATLAFDYDAVNQVAGIRAGLERPGPRQTLTVALEAATDGRLALRLGTRFGLRHSPRRQRYRLGTDTQARQGVVEARVFLDHDANGTFDADDEPLPEVAFEVDRGRHGATTGDDGLVSLGLTANQRATLRVAEGTLDDPYWLALRPGFEVLTRPGQTRTLDFPIVATGEVEGTVSLLRDGGQRAIGGVELELVDTQGTVVASTESQYDGFYLLEKILPGSYQLRVTPASVERWNLGGTTSRELVIEVGAILNGIDFALELASSPHPPRAPEASR